MSDCFPELVAEIAPIRHDFIADSELVVLDDQGRPQFGNGCTAGTALQRSTAHPLRGRGRPRRDLRLRLAVARWRGSAQRPLLQRKAALHGTLPANRRIRYAGHLADCCVELWKMANEFELEGIVAKDGRSIYAAGRTTRWQKIKTAVGAERERQRRP